MDGDSVGTIGESVGTPEGDIVNGELVGVTVGV